LAGLVFGLSFLLLLINPLRSEREAFRFLIYVAVVVALILAVVLIARAL
jgi:hypothetical protein